MTPYYERDGITIFHGDCREILPELEPGSVDLVLTDPPYGMAFSGQGEKSSQANISADGVRQGIRIIRQALFEMSPLLADDAHLLMFCHWNSYPDFYDAIAPYVKLRNALIWFKEMGGQGNIRSDYLRNYEVIMYGARGKRPINAESGFSAVLRGFTRPGNDRLHPTEKPISLLSHLVERHCPDDGLILDPFMGSGTTLRAAHDHGRRAIGIEVEERYCEIAARRIDHALNERAGRLPLGVCAD